MNGGLAENLAIILHRLRGQGFNRDFVRLPILQRLAHLFAKILMRFWIIGRQLFETSNAADDGTGFGDDGKDARESEFTNCDGKDGGSLMLPTMGSQLRIYKLLW